MKVGLIGTGTISESIHLPIWKSLPDVEITAICDSNEKQLQRVADKFQIKNRYASVDEILQSQDLDILDIATPGFTHFDIAKKALQSDINVLIEKPAALRSDEVEYLRNEAIKRDLKAGVFQTYRYREPVIEFQKVKENGGIGHIDRMVTMQRGSTIFALPPWFWNEPVSGGILFELGIHAVDLQCHLMGPHEKVLCIESHYDDKLKFTTSILAIVQYRNAIGIIDLKWLSSSNFFHHYISASVADAIIKFLPDGFVLQQSDFTPLAECMGEVKRTWDFGFSVLRKKYTGKSQMPHRIIIEDFMHSIKSNKDPIVPLTDVLPTIRLAEDIQSKMKRNQESIPLDDFRNKVQ